MNTIYYVADINKCCNIYNFNNRINLVIVKTFNSAPPPTVLQKPLLKQIKFIQC